MPNATVRANAPALPASRRAVLRSILAAGAAGTIPAVAAAALAAEAASGSAAHPDAALFALIAAARAAGARYEAAGKALEEAENQTEKVQAPQAMIVTENDTRLWKLNAGDPFDQSHLLLMKERQVHRRSSPRPSFSSILADASGNLDEKDRIIVELLTARETREDQLVAAHNQWKEARRLARDRSGETAAEERCQQLYNERCDACDRVASARARTLNGLLAKIAFVASDFDADDLLEGGTPENILASVVVDFNALRDSHALPEGLANV